MLENNTNKDRLKDITDSIEAGIKDLFQSEKYMKYLRIMSRFHKYSLNNTMLIFLQRPDSTLVCGYGKWRDQFGRNVKKGEKGIKIIAPTPYKKLIEKEKFDPDTKLPMLDADGKVIMVEKEIKIPMYKPVTVFDVSQTDGKTLPQLAADLQGNVQNYDVFTEALKRSAPVPITVMSMAANMDGYFDTEHQSIAIREGMSEVQTVCATVHEIAHSKLHNYEKEAAEPVKKKDRNTEEVEAESVSFAVCAYYGIETGSNSFGYIATWSENRELPELRASLENINKTASGLITDIDRNYSEIMKERGLDKAEPEQSAPLDIPTEPLPEMGVEEAPAVTAPENGNLPDPAISIEAMNAYGYTDSNMLPLSKERAVELFERDITVYMLFEGNSEGMAFEAEDIQLHSGIFGISREDWDKIKDSVPAMDVEATGKQYENNFLTNSGEGYCIYQLNDTPESTELRFMNFDYLQKKGYDVVRSNYNAVYSGTLSNADDTAHALSELFYTFNNDHPADFRGHSLSVSDIVALKQNGVVSCHYVDSFGYKELPAFLQPENYLKNAEMAMEDDYGMIDGAINNGPKQSTVAELEQQSKEHPISLMELAEAVKREREAPVKRQNQKGNKASVLAKLRKYQAEDRSAAAMCKSAERDL